VTERFAPGDTVALREIWDGRVFEARPATLVKDDGAGAMFHLPATVRSLQPVTLDGVALRMPALPWRLEPIERHRFRILSFAFPDTPYAVLATWDGETDVFDGWYVNLQDPLRRTEIGFDSRDHLLDVLIPPDRSSWSWKDEDELAEALAIGMFTEADAERFRWAGERAVEHILLREPPFDEDWEDWRPDPAWGLPELPPEAGLDPA
jgi:Protein of unknown function (DUF402)